MKTLFIAAAFAAAAALTTPAQAGGQYPNQFCPVGVANPWERIHCPPARHYGGVRRGPQYGQAFIGGFVLVPSPPQVQIQMMWNRHIEIREHVRIEWHIRCVTGTDTCWYVSP